MRTLLILRHAKAHPDEGGVPDHERPLNERGRRDARRVGEWLKRQALVPDVILSSTAVRARSTAELVQTELASGVPLKTEARLYLATASTYLDALSGWPDDEACLLVVGHNPGLEELVEAVTGSGEHLATAAIAHVRFPARTWSALPESGGGRLIELWRPPSE